MTTLTASLSLIGLIAIESLIYFGVPISVDTQYMLLPLFTLTLGCWAAVRVKEGTREKALTAGEAATLPIWAGVSLCGLYAAFTLLDASLVNQGARALFALMGAAAVAGALGPLLEAAPIPSALHAPLFTFVFPAIPTWVGGTGVSTPSAPSLCDILGNITGVCVAVWYWFAHGPTAWAANNALGLAFCVAAIPPFNLGSVKVGTLVLCGLFFYDIFMVFGTGHALGTTKVSIMEEVATRLDAPIKIFFIAPAGAAARAGGGHSLLGLGDIVVPGFFLALLARFDARQGLIHRKSSSDSTVTTAAATEPPAYYFNAGFIAYAAGLVATKVGMTLMDSAQPALLYLVPALLGSTAMLAIARGEIKAIWEFEEEEVIAAVSAQTTVGGGGGGGVIESKKNA